MLPRAQVSKLEAMVPASFRVCGGRSRRGAKTRASRLAGGAGNSTTALPGGPEEEDDDDGGSEGAGRDLSGGKARDAGGAGAGAAVDESRLQALMAPRKASCDRVVCAYYRSARQQCLLQR